jgi:hypothetical protein
LEAAVSSLFIASGKAFWWAILAVCPEDGLEEDSRIISSFKHSAAPIAIAANDDSNGVESFWMKELFKTKIADIESRG